MKLLYFDTTISLPVIYAKEIFGHIYKVVSTGAFFVTFVIIAAKRQQMKILSNKK